MLNRALPCRSGSGRMTSGRDCCRWGYGLGDRRRRISACSALASGEPEPPLPVVRWASVSGVEPLLFGSCRSAHLRAGPARRRCNGCARRGAAGRRSDVSPRVFKAGRADRATSGSLGERRRKKSSSPRKIVLALVSHAGLEIACQRTRQVQNKKRKNLMQGSVNQNTLTCSQAAFSAAFDHMSGC